MKKPKNNNEICSSDPCDYCTHKGNCEPCYEHAGFQGLRLTIDPEKVVKK